MHFGFPGNTATDLGSFYSSSVYCTLANRLENRKVFPRQITAGCKHNSARLDKWLEFLAVEDLTPNERWRRRPVRSAQLSHGPVVWSLTFCRRRKLGCSFQSGRGYFHFFFPSYFILWLVAVYSHCWPFLASREFCDKVFLVLIIGCFCCFLLKTRERNNCCKRASISSSRLIWTRLITRIYAV